MATFFLFACLIASSTTAPSFVYDQPSVFGAIAPLNGNTTIPLNWPAISGNVFYALQTSAADADQDGIPDTIEKEMLHTDPELKTLFVRPIKEKEGCSDPEADPMNCLQYWDAFYTKLFPGSRNGRAKIPAFNDAGIEVVVIGSRDNPYEPMRDFRYDPAKDENYPPCDIMEITLKRRRGLDGWVVHCGVAVDAHHRGHTYFMADYINDADANKSTWLWSTIGYATSGERSHKYYKSFIYTQSLDRYFKEGAYDRIEVGQKPVMTDCKKNPQKCNRLSPFNLNDNDPLPNPPYTQKPDDTVEFNEIKFDADGRITKIGKRGTPYTRHQVLARTVVHEMGHSLLGAVEQDHCQNSCCIMYRFTIDWDQKGFGSACHSENQKAGVLSCQHGPNGFQDIRAPGVVFNQVH